MKTILKVTTAIFLYIILTAQGCQEVTPSSCSGIEVFYGPLVETYGPTFDGNSSQKDRFYTADLYYRSSNQDFRTVQIEFESSSFETLTGTALLGQMPSPPPPLVLTGVTNFPETSGESYSKLATIVWRVKYTDFGVTALGKQKFTFFDAAGNVFPDCEPSFISPPSLSRVGTTNLNKPNGFVPAPEVFSDITLTNGDTKYICTEEGKLKNVVSAPSDCSYKHLELSYRNMAHNGSEITIPRYITIPHETMLNFLKTQGGTYNGVARWCEQGYISTGIDCRVCGKNVMCGKLTFKM